MPNSEKVHLETQLKDSDIIQVAIRNGWSIVSYDQFCISLRRTAIFNRVRANNTIVEIKIDEFLDIHRQDKKLVIRRSSQNEEYELNSFGLSDVLF